MKLLTSTTILILLAFAAPLACQAQDKNDNKPAANKNENEKRKSLLSLNLKMGTLGGDKVELSKYAGKVIVFVNVASKCGFTPQYKQLQELHDKYAERGLAIVGVPCNQFGNQEPGSAAEIATFCKENYGVEFEMLAKVDVKGENQSKLYKFLTGFDVGPAGAGPVEWNFEKFILNRSGVPIARFRRSVKPTSKRFLAIIQEELEIGNRSGPVAKPYSHQSGKSGRTYYLFSKTMQLKNSDKTSTIYYFAKDPANRKGIPVYKVPEDRVVSETKTGMLVLKKKSKDK